MGLAIWAVGAQSDADDAQATLDAQQEQQQRALAGASTPQADEVDAYAQQRFEEIQAEMGATSEDVADLQKELQEAAAEAEQAAAGAGSAIDQAKAEASAAKARWDVTRACLNGTLDALAAAFAGGGLQAAVSDLEGLAGGCRSAASP